MPLIIGNILPKGRAPHGARGLKLFLIVILGLRGWSRPARGAWIEIDGSVIDGLYPAVAPRTGRVD